MNTLPFDAEKVFSVDSFLVKMVELGFIDSDYLKEDYSFLVESLCHNATIWMVIQLHKHQAKHLVNFYFVTGSYKTNLGTNVDHSWLEFRKEDTPIIIDLTASQFKDTKKKLFIYEGCHPNYSEYAAIPCLNIKEIIDLADSL